MKKVFSIILLILIIASLFICTGCSKKEKNNNEGEVNKSNQNTNSEFSWPDLKEYGIPKLDKGEISSLVDNSNKDGYKINYDITINSIKKEDIEEYIKLFDSSWADSKSDNTYILVSSDRVSKYSVVIIFDEEKSMANISISSL